jgi:hypothetical protein
MMHVAVTHPRLAVQKKKSWALIQIGSADSRRHNLISNAGQRRFRPGSLWNGLGPPLVQAPWAYCVDE